MFETNSIFHVKERGFEESLISVFEVFAGVGKTFLFEGGGSLGASL